jgi:CBS domain-containing protein
MKIREIMKRDFEVTSRDTDVRAAAITMRDTHATVLPVCDGAMFAGILTDRDIAIRLAAEGYDATRTLVGEIMTRDLTYCYEDQAIDEAAMVMQFHQITHLPILDRAQQLIGVISLSDINACLKGTVNTTLSPTRRTDLETEPLLAPIGSSDGDP